MQWPSDNSSPRILIVDDERAIRLSLQAILTDEGFNVITVEGGHEAQSVLGELVPDLVISDIRLADMDGTDLLAWIRVHRPELPVIMITGMPGEDNIARTVEREASGYLVKPIRRNALLEAIGRGLYHRFRSLNDEPEPLPSVVRPPLSKQNAHTLSARDMSQIVDSFIPLCVADADGRITFANRQFEQLTGQSAQELQGTNIKSLLLREQDIYELLNAQSHALTRRCEMSLAARIGAPLQVDAIIAPLGDPDERRQIFAARDVTEYNRRKQDLEFQAFHDLLTGTLNRSGFERAMEQELARGEQLQQGVAVVYLDLDGFRSVTNRYGHAVGDDLLRQVARRLENLAGERFKVGRLSGDIYMLLIRDVQGREQVSTLLAGIARSLAGISKTQYTETPLTACSGITLFPRDGTEVERLLGNADTARAKAKSLGRNKIVFYEPSFTEEASRFMALEDQLHRALRDEMLELHYQPIVDAKTGALTAAEALLRGRGRDGELIMPADIIWVAESSGLIVDIGRWVLEKACRETVAMQAETGVSYRISVNVSVVQIESGNFLETVRTVLKQTGIDPSLLELEITESVVLGHGGAGLTFMKELCDLGVSVALDDFGTGYSSLAYLRDYPANRLKLDRSFVREVPANEADACIARAVMQMAKGLGLATVAEGVERREQANFLKALGCDDLQGYLFSVPLERDAFQKYLSKENLSDTECAS